MTNTISILEAAWASVPAPLAALIALVVGWLAALALRFLVSRLLSLARFDRIGSRTGLSEFLRKGKVKYTPSQLAGAICYWIAILAVLLSVARILDMDLYLAITSRLIQFLPNIAAGLLIAVVGLFLVAFLANFLLTILLNASVPAAALLARAIKWLGVIAVITMAMEQVGLGRNLVEFVFEALIAAVALGSAIAFGLGAKDMARDALQRTIRNLREQERGSRGADLEG